MKMTKEEAFKMLQRKKVYAGEFTKEVQEKLFEIGFEWVSRGKQIMEYKFIIIFSDGLLTCSKYKNFIEYFDNKEEITISQILGIELEPEFKDGDICYSDNGSGEMIFIYKSEKEPNRCYYHACYVKETDDCVLINDWCFTNDNIRFATKEECDTLFDAINKGGYKWNSEEKKLEKKLWRAKYGEYYYYFDTILNIGKEKDLLLRVDDERYNIYNYFKTEKEVQEYADKIKKLLLNR